MDAQKLSISSEPEFAETIRAAATADGVSVSSWLAEAATDRIRSYRLGRALDALAEEIGGMDGARSSSDPAAGPGDTRRRGRARPQPDHRRRRAPFHGTAG